MNGLAPQTALIFDAITQLDCIKPFVLVGGTALSLQIGSRLSEDLDFMRWKQGPKDKLEIDWPTIKRELEAIGHLDSENILGFDHVEFVVSGVKVSFYAAPRKRIPQMQIIDYRNNLRLADAKCNCHLFMMSPLLIFKTISSRNWWNSSISSNTAYHFLYSDSSSSLALALL
jgi:hypothetical protein